MQRTWMSAYLPVATYFQNPIILACHEKVTKSFYSLASSISSLDSFQFFYWCFPLDKKQCTSKTGKHMLNRQWLQCQEPSANELSSYYLDIPVHNQTLKFLYSHNDYSKRMRTSMFSFLSNSLPHTHALFSNAACCLTYSPIHFPHAVCLTFL